MATNYTQPGAVINYEAGADIESGDVVKVEDIFGVALVDIANGATGAVSIEGVYEVKKHNNAALEQGKKVYWHTDNGVLAAQAASEPVIGIAFEDAAEADTVCLVKLNVGI